MCYGQTGAGKTFTITGATEHYKNRGLIPRAIAQLFKEIDEKSDQSVTVRCIYTLIIIVSYQLNDESKRKKERRKKSLISP
jgi:hypothetical protein